MYHHLINAPSIVPAPAHAAAIQTDVGLQTASASSFNNVLEKSMANRRKMALQWRSIQKV